MTKKLLLIDGNSLAFRAFYAMYQQLDRMVTPEGLHTNALVAFNNFLETIILPMQPDLALVAWDARSGKETFRGDLYAEYKSGRDKTPVEFKEQFLYLREMVEAHGLHNYEQIGLEADDIIGTLSRQGEAAGYDVFIITGDQDLTQLATDHVTVKITKKGVTQIEEYTPAHIQEKFGLTPEQIIDKKALTGDTSDNYPGVTKVGEKTALKLLTEYHDLDNLYAHVDEMKKSKMKENLIADKDVAYRAQKLATIITDADLEIGLTDLTYDGPKTKGLVELFETLHFKQALNKLKAHQLVDQDDTSVEAAEAESSNFHPVRELDDAAVATLATVDSFALQIDTTSDNYHTADLIAFAIGNDKVGYFASRDFSWFENDQLKALIENPAKKVRLFNAKEHWVLLHRLGLKLAGVDFDFMLVAYLLDTVGNDNVLATLASRFGAYLPEDEEVYGKGAKFAVPTDDQLLYNHLGHKAEVIDTLRDQAFADLEEHQQSHLYHDIELPLSFVLAKMEAQGFMVNEDRLSKMGQELDEKIAQLKDQIYQIAGEEFNINSTKQLGELLFEKMNLPVIKKTKTGYSTAVEVLEQLAPQAPIVSHILEYRQLAKIKSTYVDGLLAVVSPVDQKIHTRFLQTLTQTGRLSSVDPNLQNIPMRTEEGRKIRHAFVPSQPDYLIFGADYSQIELRVLAAITGDPNMKKAFMDDDDIHAETARAVFGLGPDEEVDANHRRTAKAVNFGIVYGISDFGLSKNLGISRKDAKEFIETYFREFPKIHDWMEQIKEQAHRDGFVETIEHRRRYLPEINSKNFNRRSFAERTAMNSPIQGSAADIIKIAMIKVNQAIEEQNLKAKMLVQVHDELVFECPQEELEQVRELVTSVMDSAVSLSVPLKVEDHSGPTWYEAK
ncbi:DNA polymerase I [Fructobacillus pseudoficulneus]|uniref:DNA polymerase I n=1 Tax=Fructobacillus pseudoficulneus TaxID=220714 RepID=A0A3F3H0Q3_9LACO|nr:DNA polymerase I [Fructobacillus pseudoficulneus]GAP02248.1 DNA polymerase I [Fructobacillus pseudoficulneus]SEH36191.1 DNA polymerase I [Fructobacillus pseudoficulneus]